MAHTSTATKCVNNEEKWKWNRAVTFTSPIVHTMRNKNPSPLRAPGSLPTKTPDFPSAVCVAVQSLSRVWLFVTPWTAVLRLLCPPISWNLLKLRSIELVMILRLQSNTESSRDVYLCHSYNIQSRLQDWKTFTAVWQRLSCLEHWPHGDTLLLVYSLLFTHSIQNDVKERAGTQKYLMDGWMSALLSDNILSVRFDYHPYYLNEKTVAYMANWCVSRLLSSWTKKPGIETKSCRTEFYKVPASAP